MNDIQEAGATAPSQDITTITSEGNNETLPATETIVIADGESEAGSPSEEAEGEVNGKQTDSAGKPLHGNLRQRAIHRHSEFKFFADQMRPRGHNLRLWDMPRNRAKVIEFAQTAFTGGIRVPVSVYFEEDDREILLEHGETRWLAVKLLEGDDVRGVLRGVTDPKILGLLGALPKNTIEIPAVQAPRRSDEDLLRDTIVHNSGNQFHDLELADAIKRYTAWGKSQTEIAEILGGEAGSWTQTRVSHLHQLNFASAKLRQLLMEERISTTVVVNAMRDHGRDAESFVLGAIDDAKEAAAAVAVKAEAEAVAAQAEVERIKTSGDESMVAPEPGKRAIPKLEAAQRRATAAADRAEAAKRTASDGPTRVSGKDIAMAVIRRKPNARVRPTLSKAAVAAFIDAVQFEAQYSPSPKTRERLNAVLKHYGFPEMPVRVDDSGEPLAAEEPEGAAAATSA